MGTALTPHSQHLVAWLSGDSVAGPVVLVWLLKLCGGKKNHVTVEGT